MRDYHKKEDKVYLRNPPVDEVKLDLEEKEYYLDGKEECWLVPVLCAAVMILLLYVVFSAHVQ